MLVHKGHKIQLLPNDKQQTKFLQWAGVHRWAYNWGLNRKIKAYCETGKSPGGYVLANDIVVLKRTGGYAWLKDAPKSIPRVALVHLDKAYSHFFHRVKNGDKKKGFPKWKSRKRSKIVFHLELNTVKIAGNKVRIPKLGWIKMTKPLRFDGKLVSTIAISKKAGKWYISFAVETEHVPIESQNGAVGIDLGIKILATLSDGVKFENPVALKQYKRLLTRAQRQLVKKKKGSKHQKKAKLRVQRIHKRIADIRSDATHKASSYIVNNHSSIAMENLNVAGMMKNHCLARAIGDANFAEIRRQITYKAAWNKRKIGFVSTFFPSSKTCSTCGCINDNLTLADREWICFDCGTCHDRDINAAKNILTKVTAEGFRRLGVEDRVQKDPPEKRQGIIFPICELTQTQVSLYTT